MQHQSSSIHAAYSKLPANQTITVLKASWLLAKKHYGLILAIAITQVLPMIVLDKIPIFGPVLSGLLVTLLSVGALVVSRKIVQAETVKYQDLFTAFRDQTVLRKITPFIAIVIILEVIMDILTAATESIFKNLAGDTVAVLCTLMFYLLAIMMICVMLYFIWFVPALILFKDMKTMDAINDSVGVVVKEWWAFTVLGFWIFLYILAAMILFVLPVLFVYLPGMVCFSYLLYAVYFENLDIEQFHEKLRTLP